MRDQYLNQQPIGALTKEQRHERRMGWLMSETHRQRANRQRMARCEAYYDLYQYDAKTKAAIEARGQYAIVFDRTAPQIDFLIGTERRTRIDYRVDPRFALDEEATADAENKTMLLKWLDDTGDAAFERSNAFSGAMKSGLGWAELAIDEDLSGDTPIIEKALSWREVVHDSFGTDLNTSSMRYIFRLKVVDLDIALAYFPEFKEELLRVRVDASTLEDMQSWLKVPGGVLDLTSLWGSPDEQQAQSIVMPQLFNGRERVMLIECWSMEPRRSPAGGKPASLSDPIKMVPAVSIMTEFTTLWEGWSPYDHGKFPFVPCWAYRESRTGLPYGPIRRAMDKQDALNRAMSRAHLEVATSQIIAEADAFDDEVMTAEEVRDEVDDPEGTILLARGGKQKFEVRRGFDKAEAHMALADRYANALDESSGITRESRGMDTSPLSGKARQIKEAQGGVITAELFDNLLLFHKRLGEIKLSLAEQFMVNPIAVPITGERGQRKMLEVNQWDAAAGKWVNDITARKARFTISEQPWRATMAAAQFEQLMELLGQLAPTMPQVVTALLDIVFEFADVPNKKSVLERIRAVTGQPGPDNKPTPEQQAQQAKSKALAEAEFAAKLEGLKAQVAEARGKGQKLEADAIMRSLEGLYTAAQTAQVLQANPGAAPMADELLKSVGFTDKHPDATPIQPGNPQAMPAQPGPQPVSPLAGYQAGIQTPGADGVTPQETPQ